MSEYYMNNFDAPLNLKNKKNETHGTKKLTTMPNLQLPQETNIEVRFKQGKIRIFTNRTK